MRCLCCCEHNAPPLLLPASSAQATPTASTSSKQPDNSASATPHTSLLIYACACGVQPAAPGANTYCWCACPGTASAAECPTLLTVLHQHCGLSECPAQNWVKFSVVLLLWVFGRLMVVRCDARVLEWLTISAMCLIFSSLSSTLRHTTLSHSRSKPGAQAGEKRGSMRPPTSITTSPNQHHNPRPSIIKPRARKQTFCVLTPPPR